MSKSKRFSLGPGPIIAAAFIGPGTVTVCTIAGVKFGYELIWALGLSIIATILLQEMSARIGLITQKGLVENIRQTLPNPWLKWFSLSLVLIAIVIGNAAYEAGNISGGTLGLSVLIQIPELSIGKFSINGLNLFIGGFAWLLLMKENFQSITKYLTVLVLLMSITFIGTAWMILPSWKALFAGFVPKWDQENILTVVALIGTTVVPYNLFLHAALVSQKWKKSSDLYALRKDSIVAIFIGGLVSMAILITSANTELTEVINGKDLAMGIEPLLGDFGKYFIGLGLFAAGITSAITAPLAGGLVIAACFQWSTDLKTPQVRWAISGILLLGIIFSSLGIKPITLIMFAQLTNGILLPLISGYIIWLVNQKGIMGKFTNSITFNVFAIVIWLITLMLGLKSISQVWQQLI
jgi:manganese transport protein